MLPDLPSLPGLPGRARRRPTLTEIDDSVLADVLSPVMGGLDMLGRALDAPGKYLARYPLSGFSNDARDYETGRGLLEHWGILGKNTPGLDTGDVLGFGAEVALDPLNLISGPGKALTGLGLEAAQQAGRFGASGFGRALGTTADDVIREIAAGQRGLIGFKLPGILGVSEQVPLGAMFSGPTAAKVAEFAAYNPVTSFFKPLLSHHASKYGAVRSLRSGMIRAADQAYSQEVNAIAEFRTLATDYLDRGGELRETIEGWLSSVPNAPNFDDLIRRTYEVSNSQPLADQLLALGINAPREEIIAASDATKGLFDELVQVKDKWHDEGMRLGFDWSNLVDDWISHMPRRLGLEQKQALKEDLRSFRGMMEFARRDELRNIPGGTEVINNLVKDIRLTDLNWAAGDMPALRESAWGKPLKQVTRDDRVNLIYDELAGAAANTVAGPMPQETLDKIRASSEQLADYLGGLKAHSWTEIDAATGNWSTGLFNRAVVDDMMDDITQRIRSVHWMKGVHSVLSNPSIVGNSKEGVSLIDAWRTIGDLGNGRSRLTDLGAKELVANNYEALAKIAGLAPGTPLDNNSTAHILSNVTVPERVARSFNRTIRAAVDPTASSELVGMFDKASAFFRGSQTLPFPGFWIRNLMSGMWQNWASGALTTKAFGETMEALKTGKFNPDRLAHMKAFADDIYGRSPGRAYADMVTQWGGDNLAGVPTKGSIDAGYSGAAALFDQINPLGAPWRETEGWDRAKFWKMRGVGDDGTKKSGFLPARVGENANGMVEFTNRTSAFFSLLDKGLSPAEAAREVKRLHFDYSELSDFERNFMRRIMSFYTWQRKNLPMQLENLLNDPGGRTAQTVRGLSRLRGDSSDEYTPQHVKAKGSIKWEDLDATTTRYLNLGTLLPIANAVEDFELSGAGAGATTKRLAQNVLSDTLPFINYPVEQFTGEDTFTGRKLNTLHPYPTGNVPVDNLLANLPFSRALTATRQFQDERKGWLPFGINMLTGLRVTDQDRELGAMIDARRLLERQLDADPAVRDYQRFYVPKDQRATTDQETLDRLALYNQLLQLAKKPRP